MKNTFTKKIILIMILILPVSHLTAASIINETLLAKINTDGDETSCTMTGDDKLFIFARKMKDKDNSDLYYSEFVKGKWTEIKPLSELNTDSDEISPYVSPDGKFIMFSSDRPEGLKNTSADQQSYDIYYSEKKKGGWSKPTLLYGTINSTDDELYPFITKDKKTLYVTRLPFDEGSKATILKVANRDGVWEDLQTAEISKNQDADIYMYKKSFFRPGSYITGFKKDDLKNRKVFYSDEAQKKITELDFVTDSSGSSGDEISVTELNKDTVIIASNAAGIGGSYDLSIKQLDIEDTPVKIEKAPEKVRDVTEKVIDTPEKVTVTHDNLTVKIESANYSNPDGVKIQVLFFSSLQKNAWPVKNELRSPDSSGFIEIIPDTDTKRVLVLPGGSDMKPFAVEFLIKNKKIPYSIIKIEPAARREFTAKPVYFGFNSAEISTSDIPYLQEMIFFLRENEDAEISLEGYADGAGSYKSNLEISSRRTEKIRDFLIKAGIDGDRIKVKGLGFIKKNTSDTAQYNRRVDTEIITE